MKRLIKFMTHAGRVPYFVEDYTSVPAAGEFAGVSYDTDDCYLPDTVTIINAEGFLAHYAAAGDDGQPLLDKWTTQGNIKTDTDDIIRYVRKVLILERLEAENLKDETLAALKSDEWLHEKWSAATEIDSADAQVRAMLTEIGADPDEILKPEEVQ